MPDNKDYILNIRVSKELYEKLKTKAKDNSESLSDLVRKSLDDSWEIFGDLKNEIFGQKETDNILHYQKVIIAKDTKCNRCNALTLKGNEMFLGETKTGAKRYFCTACFVPRD